VIHNNRELEATVERIEQQIQPKFKEIDALIDANTWKVLQSFQKFRVSDYHFAGSTGYGYSDRGRETLDAIYADVFGAEAGLVRPHFASGTHAIATALFGLLRPGDEVMFLTGSPYDTLHKVIGQHGDGQGSLRDLGIQCTIIPLTATGDVDWPYAEAAFNERVKVVAIQRSRGYDWRASFTISDIQLMVERVKQWNSQVVTFLDNCYGEFTEMLEPTEDRVGIDIMAGSLIKNPGGGLAPTGGYIVGKQRYVQKAAYRLTAPGVGAEIGSMLGTTKFIFQGLFMAPHIVGQALKGAIFAAAMFETLGFMTHPRWEDARSDLIQAIRFRSERQLISFVQSIQKVSPVDAHVTPEPWQMPGYQDRVIMAAGTFVQGASLELSADAPIREPFTAYMQGGLSYSHVKISVIKVIEIMINENLV
jgi:cystathionine beta-lyase family protein involved in aluminum resistance